MSIKRLSIKGLIKNPKYSNVYKDYDRLSVDDYGGLLVYLYSGRTGKWENPLTHVELKRNSNIILSFLSFCYYKLDDGSKVDIKGHNMTYKEHVLNFIDEIYLYEEDRKATAAMATASARSARTPSPARARSPSPSRGTAQAARGAPAAPAQQAAAPAALAPAALAALAAKSSSSSGKMSYSPTASYKAAKSIIEINYTANRLTKEEALNFVKELRALKKGKTPAQMKMLTIKNPITSSRIGLKGQAFQRLMHKLYNYDDEDLKKAILKVVSKNFLDDINRHINDIKTGQNTAAEKKKAAALKAAEEAKAKEIRMQAVNKQKCEEYIAGCIKDFHKRCDELEAECDANGVLSSYSFITNVVNAIVVVILTKYLHLTYYYDDLFSNYKYDNPLPIWLIMFDDEMKKYCDNKKINPVNEMIDYAFNKGTVVYQHNNFKLNVTKGVLDNIERTNDAYSINTLLNSQYIFDMRRKDWDDNGRRPRDLQFITPTLTYNHFNELDTRKFSTFPFPSLQFPHTLHYALQQFSFRPFKYNITNSGLPRTVFIATTDAILNTYKPFSELIGEINERLAKMPRITGIAKEATVRHAYYEGVLKGMEGQSFGSNDEIRRNILYSLNAQTPDYVDRAYNYYQNIFFNQGYTGMFPIFTWVPCKIKGTGAANSIYNMVNHSLWQPYGSKKNTEFQKLGNAYKNHGVAPWSKMLNEAIYKVITKVHSSVLEIPNTPQDRERMLMRVMDTIGVYKSMDIDPQYANNNLYFYHGTANRLHTMKDRDNDIQILGFLSTSLNIYTASYYCEVVTKGQGYIYIIETDDKQGYINLNDQLYQYILLPNTIIRILYEFEYGAITIILCRLIMTPTKEENNALYENLLGMFPADAGAAAGPVAGAAGAAGAAGVGSSGSSGSSSGSSRAAGASPKLSGGLHSMNGMYAIAANAATAANPKAIRSLMAKQGRFTANAANAANAASHSDTKNIIKPKADMRKIGNMPADIREYYGLTLTEQNKNEKVDINNGCYVRMISRKVVDRMLADRV
jgi:hypothetical protein